MMPAPNLAPPAVRKVTPLVVKPSGGRYMPKPRRGATEPKSIVDTFVDAAVNDSRLSMCSMVDCAPVRGAKESAKEKITAHNATVLRGMYCKSLTPCSAVEREDFCH